MSAWGPGEMGDGETEDKGRERGGKGRKRKRRTASMFRASTEEDGEERY